MSGKLLSIRNMSVLSASLLLMLVLLGGATDQTAGWQADEQSAELVFLSDKVNADDDGDSVTSERQHLLSLNPGFDNLCEYAAPALLAFVARYALIRAPPSMFNKIN